MKYQLMFLVIIAVLCLAGAVSSRCGSVVTAMSLNARHIICAVDTLSVVGNEHRVNWASDTILLSSSSIKVKITSPIGRVNALPSVSGTLALTTFSGYSVGSIAVYAGTTVPAGFLKCDGQIISRATYSRLFSVIGTNYSPGNGTTTFGLPNITHPILSYAIRFD